VSKRVHSRPPSWFAPPFFFPCWCVVCTNVILFPFASFLFARWEHVVFQAQDLGEHLCSLAMFFLCPHYSRVYVCVILCFCVHHYMFFRTPKFFSLFLLSYLQGWECGGWGTITITQASSSLGFKWTPPPYVYALLVSMFFTCLCV